ncbi:60S ribosomal protein L31 [Candidatus Woesearchaeota archaeon]|nr:60S ribosomal protein L31 [Candidatus Woesearchaeota archaeon]
MAKKEKKKEAKTVLERIYIVPMRKAFLSAPNWKRTPRAVRALRAFILRHMKATKVIIGKHLNQKMWGRGIKHPPHKVKIECKKDEEGVVFAELFGAPKEKVEEKKAITKPESSIKKEPRSAPAEDEQPVEISVKEALGGEEVPKAEQAKIIEKEEIRELKKEHHPQHSPKQEAIPKKIVHHMTGGPKQKG